jgi:hypothetical protein
MNIKNLTLISLISGLLITLIYTSSNAKDLDLQDIEQALGIKTKACSTPPCSVEIDSLLDKLIHEHKKERKNSNKLNDSQQAIDSSQNNPLVRMSRAELIILNKITAKSTKVVFNLGEIKFFGNLSIEVHKCIKSTDPFNANNLMLLTVFDNKIDDDDNLSVFHGWVLSSNPSLSTLEHPVYEVLPVKCIPAEEK